jgi:hypothetical protein
MNKDLRVGLAWAGGMIGLALGYIDQDAVLRIVIGVNGLMVAYYGNLVPKRVAPSAYARQVGRVAGWSQVISGLIYAGAWAFAPIQQAVFIGCGAIIAGILVTLAYCVRLRLRRGTQLDA